jgi:hypothetical protein
MTEQHQALTQQITEALDQGTRQLDAETLSHLYASRRQALAAVHAQHAGRGILALKRHPLLLTLSLGAILLLAAWFAQYRHAVQHPPAADTSELDIQLLTGEVPPQVFADWGLVTQENVEAICLHDS